MLRQASEKTFKGQKKSTDKNNKIIASMTGLDGIHEVKIINKGQFKLKDAKTCVCELSNQNQQNLKKKLGRCLLILVNLLDDFF